MTRYGAVLNFSGPLPDGDGICDLTARVSKDTSVLRAAYATLGSQVPQQLLLRKRSILTVYTRGKEGASILALLDNSLTDHRISVLRGSLLKRENSAIVAIITSNKKL